MADSKKNVLMQPDFRSSLLEQNNAKVSQNRAKYFNKQSSIIFDDVRSEPPSLPHVVIQSDESSMFLGLVQQQQQFDIQYQLLFRPTSQLLQPNPPYIPMLKQPQMLTPDTVPQLNQKIFLRPIKKDKLQKSQHNAVLRFLDQKGLCMKAEAFFEQYLGDYEDTKQYKVVSGGRSEVVDTLSPFQWQNTLQLLESVNTPFADIATVRPSSRKAKKAQKEFGFTLAKMDQLLEKSLATNLVAAKLQQFLQQQSICLDLEEPMPADDKMALIKELVELDHLLPKNTSQFFYVQGAKEPWL